MKGRDVEELVDPLVLGLLAGGMRVALNDGGCAHGALLAPRLLDLIGRSPRARIARELEIQLAVAPKRTARLSCASPLI